MDGVDAMDGMDGMWPATKNGHAWWEIWEFIGKNTDFNFQPYFNNKKWDWTDWIEPIKKINDKTHTKASKQLTKHIHLYWGDTNTLRISFDLQHLVFFLKNNQRHMGERSNKLAVNR